MSLVRHSLYIPFPKLLSNHELKKCMHRKFSLVKYGCQLLRAPLRGILGTEQQNLKKTTLVLCAFGGQGDTSCSTSLNILAGNISDAFPFLFHHFLSSFIFFFCIFLFICTEFTAQENEYTATEVTVCCLLSGRDRAHDGIISFSVT